MSELKIDVMKISKNLLTAIALGVSLGATTSSCSYLTDSVDDVVVECQDCPEIEEGGEGKQQQNHVCYDCPACGLG